MKKYNKKSNLIIWILISLLGIAVSIVIGVSIKNTFFNQKHGSIKNFINDNTDNSEHNNNDITESEESGTENKIKKVLTFRDNENNILLTSEFIEEASIKRNINNLEQVEYLVIIKFNKKGAKKIADITAQMVGESLNIYLEDKHICSPIIYTAITGGEVQITGFYNKEEAQEIVDSIMN